MVIRLPDVNLCESELKSFVKSDNLFKEPENFEKLLVNYTQSLIELLDTISFLNASVLD